MEEPCDCHDGTAVTESGFLSGKNGIFEIVAVFGGLGAIGYGVNAGVGAVRGRRKPKAPTA